MFEVKLQTKKELYKQSCSSLVFVYKLYKAQKLTLLDKITSGKHNHYLTK